MGAALFQDDAGVIPFLAKEGGYRDFPPLRTMSLRMEKHMARMKEVC